MTAPGQILVNADALIGANIFCAWIVVIALPPIGASRAVRDVFIHVFVLTATI
jgi:hypothetical protein